MATEALIAARREAAGSRRLAGSLVLLMALSLPGRAVEVEVRDGLVSVRAEEESLRDVLEAVAVRCDLDIRSNASMPESVTLDLGPWPLPRLLRSLLRDHSYMLNDGTGGRGARSLWILAPAGDHGPVTSWSVELRDHAIDEIVLALADPDPETRMEAVLALGDIGSPDVEPFLVQSLSDTSDDVRETARAVLEDIDMAEAGSPGPVDPGAD